MTKKKVALSIDKDLIDLIDIQRGNESRSSYINRLCKDYFFPDKSVDTSLVTHEELSAQLKPVHENMKGIGLMFQNVKDLERIVYEYLFDVKEGKGEIMTAEEVVREPEIIVEERPHIPIPEKPPVPKPAKIEHIDIDKIKKDVKAFVKETLEKHGDIKWTRDKGRYLDIPNVGSSHVAFSKHMHNNGLWYNARKGAWSR